MTPLVEYGLRVNLFLCLFYGLYWLILRRYTFLQQNRAYLLGTLVASFALPLVDIPVLHINWLWPTNVPSAEPIIVAEAGYVTGLHQSITPAIDWVEVAVTAYLLITLLFFLRVIWQIGRLGYQLRQWPSERYSDYTLVMAPHADVPTFSFFRYLVLNPADATSATVREHELTHIRQRHSLDLLLTDLAHALCWVNPVLFGYRRSLRQLHEFLADQSAMQTTASPDEYAHLLLQYAFNVPPSGPTHSFGAVRLNSPTLKQRIQMLYTPQTNRRARWQYLLTLPLCVLMMAMTTSPPTIDPTPGVRSNAKLVVNPLPDAPTPTNQDTSRVYTVVDKTPKFPGGMAALFAYLGQNIRYPKEAIRRNVQGKVFVNFVVGADGSISRVKVLKGIGAGCDAEALRVVRQMPKWIPGKQNGKPVAVLYNLPIAFLLSEKGDKVGKGRLPSLPKLNPNTLEFSHPLSTTLNGIPQRPGFRLDTLRLRKWPIYDGSYTHTSMRPFGPEPLFVLDGSVISKDKFSELKPGVIESISVLKGASAQASVYGVRAEHGVIIIKTKAK